ELLARVRTHLELKHARDRLREMNEEKNEFMGIVAHDLRNPLGAITGYSEMVLEELESLHQIQEEPLARSVRQAAQCTERIRDVSHRMTEMVKNLLDTNRIERGEMNLSLVPTDLPSLVSTVVETQRSRAVEKKQVLHLDNAVPPIQAVVDPGV